MQYGLYKINSDYDIIYAKRIDAYTNMCSCKEIAVRLHLDVLDYIVNYPEE